MKSIIRLILALAIIAATGTVCFYAYTTYAQGTDLITTSGSGEGVQVLSQLQQLESLSLSNAIFQTAAFQSLVDFTVPIVPEPVSRPNPFAPIGQD